MSGFKAKMH